MKETHFRQKEAHGCGLYSIANVYRDKSIITEKRLNESRNGNNVGQMSKWLQEDGYNVFIEPMFFSSTARKLPKSICGLTPSGDGVQSIPILLDVQFSKGGKMHFIAAELLVNGNVIILDSLQEGIDITTLEGCNKKYWRVFGLWYLRGVDDGNYLMRHDN